MNHFDDDDDIHDHDGCDVCEPVEYDRGFLCPHGLTRRTTTGTEVAVAATALLGRLVPRRRAWRTGKGW